MRQPILYLGKVGYSSQGGKIRSEVENLTSRCAGRARRSWCFGQDTSPEESISSRQHFLHRLKTQFVEPRLLDGHPPDSPSSGPRHKFLRVSTPSFSFKFSISGRGQLVAVSIAKGDSRMEFASKPNLGEKIQVFLSHTREEKEVGSESNTLVLALRYFSRYFLWSYVCLSNFRGTLCLRGLQGASAAGMPSVSLHRRL